MKNKFMNNKRSKLFFFLFGFLIIFSLPTYADDDLEKLYEEMVGSEDAQEQERQKVRKKKIFTSRDRNQLKEASDIYGLETFKDLAVISKKYLPRTKRSELSVQGILFGNNNFVHNLGINAHAAWYFSEKWGAEASFFYAGKIDRSIKDSFEKLRIGTSIIIPKMFQGIYLKWSFLYGKMSFLEKSILSFDMPLKLGWGQTKTLIIEEKNDGPSRETLNVSTISFGISPTWALNKSWAVRGEILTNFHNTIDGAPEDIIISLGVSYFFPDVSYR